MNELIQAGAKLNHIRGIVCKALRAGAENEELQALLRAEEIAKHELKAIMEVYGS